MARPGGPPVGLVGWAAVRSLELALKNYEENRLNGGSADSPKSPFPGFNLSSVTTWNEFDKDFKYEEDRERGYPDKADKNRYWFAVIHKATGTRLTGFSQEADYEKGFPDSNGNYWYYVKFHEKECPPIRDWMEERDRNYLRRIQKEDPELYKKEIKNHPDHPPVKQHLEELEKEKQAEIAREREEQLQHISEELEKLREREVQRKAEEPYKLEEQRKVKEQLQHVSEELQQLRQQEAQRQAKKQEKIEGQQRKEEQVQREFEEQEQLRHEREQAKVLERARRGPKSDFMSELWPAVEKDNNKLNLPSIPENYLCPITQEIMIDPVMAMDGHTYEREAIENHIEKTRAISSVHDSDEAESSAKKTTPSKQPNRQPTSPMTGEPLGGDMVLPNMAMRSMINGFLDQNPAYRDEVFLSVNQCTKLRELASGKPGIDVSAFESLLKGEPRFLTKPLGEDKSNLLLSYICQQEPEAIKAYLPVMFSLLKKDAWRALLTQRSAQSWLTSLAVACDKADILPAFQEYLPMLESVLDAELTPINWAQFALETSQMGLFRLFFTVSQRY